MNTASRSEREDPRPGSDAQIAPEPGVTKRLLLRGTEAALALMLVLFFFLTFVGLVGFVFPEGTGISVLVSPSEWVLEQPAQSEPEFEEEDDEARQALAWLAETRRLVKAKDSRFVAWSNAHSGMSLRNRHAVQTLTNAGAVIAFGDNNQIELGEDALIVIRRPERRYRKPDYTSVFLAGTLELPEETGPAAGQPLEVMTANGATAIFSEGVAGSRLRITQNPDQTATFALHSGTAQIVSGGRTVTLTANRAVTVDGSTAPGAPIVLPGRPVASEPSDGYARVFRSTPPRLRFAWEGEQDGDAYRVEIARDAGFKNVVFDRRIEAAELVHGNLPAGSYFWRVSATLDWAEGPASPARRLELTRDDEPPALEVDFPGGPVRDELVLLKGTTEPGARVLIDGSSVRADDAGGFEHALSLQRGVTLVVVEAFDRAGNVSYRSELVHAKY